MRYAAMVVSTMLMGCATAPGSFSELMTPEVGAAQPAASVEEPASEDGFAFDGYVEQQTDADGVEPALDDPDAVVEELGAVGVEVPFEAPFNDPLPQDAPLAMGYDEPIGQITPMSQAPPRWSPDQAVTLSWGLRLVTTLDETTPPRAILGLPDGSESVVMAGDLLPSEGIIVLAIGSGIVQLGRVTPQGDHASVESVFLQSMFDAQGGGR